jgi:glycosyltransferase involved in cell wall biosynthesis
VTPSIKMSSPKSQKLRPRANHGQLPPASPSPWVLVAGGFHLKGGMDRANLMLAQYLVEQGTPINIVCYSIDPDLARHPLVTVHLVSRPANSYFLGRPLLDFVGRRTARRVQRRWPDARVLVNGDSCLWPGINWVHYVHAAWDEGPPEGPVWFRAKQTLNRWLVRRSEQAAARIGRLFVTNSDRTSRDLIERLGVDSRRVHTIYLGAESDWGLVTPVERSAARKSFGISEDRFAAVFIGSIGHDRRKGFDVLLEAWRRLCADPQWDVDLLVAGSGSALGTCREHVSQWRLDHRVRILGFCDRVMALLAAADLLVSPVRYEAYGLNVQEAICRGIPAIVSAGAGVAERYGSEYAPLLLPDPEDVDSLVERLKQWRANMAEWRSRFEQFGAELRGYSWQEMARRIVAMAEQAPSQGSLAGPNGFGNTAPNRYATPSS